MKIGHPIRLFLFVAAMTYFANPLTATAQALPEAAILPEGKGAWAVDQLFKTNILAGSFKIGYIRVVILSDGKVFHRKSFDKGQPATPWCQDQFTAEEMRDIRSAMARATPNAWQQHYGEWINVLAPFRRLTITVRAANGKAVDYLTLVYREYAMPDEIARIAKATDAAGELAFYNCQKSREEGTSNQEEKPESGATTYAVNQAGDLLWYNHSGFQNGEWNWANQAQAKQVGHQWADNIKAAKGLAHHSLFVDMKNPKAHANCPGLAIINRKGDILEQAKEFVTQMAFNDEPSGRWRVQVGKGGVAEWTWIYNFDVNGNVTWLDPFNQKTGRGAWRVNGQVISISWINSTTKETWNLPLRPTAQTGDCRMDGEDYDLNAVRL